jgi:mono/diheme cytochrome c family protein
MPGSVRIALIGGAFVLSASSAATLRSAASPPLQGPALSISHQADQDTARRARPISGQNIFRFDTFDDEQLWTNVLRMHEAIPSVKPVTALAVGLKVDIDALPPALIAALQAGQVDLTDPAVTIELLRLNAVVGVIGKVDDLGQLTSIGTTCALCHSTVDNSFTTGIGKRLDGWPNRDLNVGAILGLSPALDPALKTEFSQWGPGKYDPRHHVFDGTNIIPLIIPPDSPPTVPVLIPPAYGLQGVGFETYTGDGPISYWNSYVGVSQMGGQGTFTDPRIGVFITQKPDRVTPKLPALRDYQLGLSAPVPPSGSFNAAAARRGERLFSGKAACSTCHKPPTYTDVLSGPDPSVPFLHDPAEVGTEAFYAARSATGQYRTSPLRGIWQHPPYFHDGSASDLLAVVNHYDALFRLNLSTQQKADLVEFLKSL